MILFYLLVHNLSFIEALKFNNYKIKNITNILCLQQHKFQDIEYSNIFNKYIKSIDDIYNIDKY